MTAWKQKAQQACWRQREESRKKLREWNEEVLGTDCIVHGLSNNASSSTSQLKASTQLPHQILCPAKESIVHNIKQRSRRHRGDCPHSFLHRVCSVSVIKRRQVRTAHINLTSSLDYRCSAICTTCCLFYYLFLRRFIYWVYVISRLIACFEQL